MSLKFGRSSSSPPRCIFLIIIIIAVLSFIVKAYGVVITTTYTVAVSGKERICDSSGSQIDCYYIVYGRNGEVFSNQDSVMYWKWDSASVQARIIEGRRYKIRASGFRIPFLSMKPNIISIERIDEQN